QAQVYVVQLVVFGGAWVLGAVARSRRLATEALEERAALLEREQGRQAEAAVRDERARIARELHDIVAHNVSVVVVQAEAAADAVEDDPAATRRALVAIRDSGRLALTEMRRLLGVLHVDGDEPAE